MASIDKDIPIDAHPDAVWSAMSRFGALPTRLVPVVNTSFNRNVSFGDRLRPARIRAHG